MLIPSRLTRLAVGCTIATTLAGTASAREQEAAMTSATTDWGRITLSSGVNYSTGKYGEDTSTDILYVPLTGKWERDDWVVKLTVPYIAVTGPGNVVQGVGVVRSDSSARTTQSGLGDVVASLGKTVYDSPATGTAVDLTGKIKFGTADADKGLGTGATDYSLAVEPSQQLGPVTLFGTLGYKWVGDPEGMALNNVVFGSLGASSEIIKGTTAGLEFDTQTRSSPAAAEAPREITVFASTKLDQSWKVQAYVSRGLSDASPDWSGGAMASLRF